MISKKNKIKRGLCWKNFDEIVNGAALLQFKMHSTFICLFYCSTELLLEDPQEASAIHYNWEGNRKSKQKVPEGSGNLLSDWWLPQNVNF